METKEQFVVTLLINSTHNMCGRSVEIRGVSGEILECFSFYDLDPIIMLTMKLNHPVYFNILFDQVCCPSFEISVVMLGILLFSKIT